MGVASGAVLSLPRPAIRRSRRRADAAQTHQGLNQLKQQREGCRGRRCRGNAARHCTQGEVGGGGCHTSAAMHNDVFFAGMHEQRDRWLACTTFFPAVWRLPTELTAHLKVTLTAALRWRSAQWCRQARVRQRRASSARITRIRALGGKGSYRHSLQQMCSGHKATAHAHSCTSDAGHALLVQQVLSLLSASTTRPQLPAVGHTHTGSVLQRR